MYVEPIVKQYVRTYQPEDRYGYIRLDQNENPDGVPMWIYEEAMKRVTPDYLGMYPEELSITKKYAKKIGLEFDNVKFTDGSVVAMSYVIKVFGEPGKKLLCVTPTFGMYKVYADLKGMDTEFLAYKEDFTFDIQTMLDAIDDDVSIVSIVNPNMPIGNAYQRDEIEAVIQTASEHDSMVVVDEAYYYFHEKTVLDLIKKYDNLIILRTFSKMLSLSGLRVGVVISNPNNIKYIRNYMPHYTVNCVALAFVDTIVDNYERVVSELTDKFRDGKKYITSELDRLGYSYLPTEGCFLCIRPREKTAEQITEELKKQNILIFCGKGDSAGFLRVTIWGKEHMKKFVSALEKIDV